MKESKPRLFLACCFLAAAWALSAVDAGAAPKEIKINQVELSDYEDRPCIVIDLNLVDEHGKPVQVEQNVVDSIMVQEDGRPIPPTERKVVRQTEADLASPTPAVQAGENGVAPTPTADISSRGPLTVLLVVDVSGSMKYPASKGERTSKIEALKKVLLQFIDRKGPQDQIGILPFHSVVGEPDSVKFSADPAPLKSEVEKLRPLYNTCLYKAVSVGLEVMAKQSGRRTMIVLTDGKDSGDSGSGHLDPKYKMKKDEILRLVEKSGLQVHTVGFGDPDIRGEDGLDEEVVRSLKSNTGEYYSIRTADELSNLWRGFTATFAAEFHVYFRSRHARNALIGDIKYKVSAANLTAPELTRNFSDVAGNIQVPKDSFRAICESIKNQALTGKPTSPVRSAESRSKGKRAREVMIIYLIALAALGGLFFVPFLFGRESLAPEREIQGNPAAGFRPQAGGGFTGKTQGYRPKAAAPAAAFPMPEGRRDSGSRDEYKETAAPPEAWSASTVDPAGPAAGAGGSPLQPPTATVPASANREDGLAKQGAAAVQADEPAPPCFRVRGPDGAVTDLYIHEIYFTSPLGQVFDMVRADYEAAGYPLPFSGKVAAFRVRGMAVDLGTTVSALGLRNDEAVETEIA
jgi:Mg-chelatase subunit ChlD